MMYEVAHFGTNHLKSLVAQYTVMGAQDDELQWNWRLEVSPSYSILCMIGNSTMRMKRSYRHHLYIQRFKDIVKTLITIYL